MCNACLWFYGAIGSQLAEDEEVLIRGTTVRVEGAGAAHVNGDYTFDAVKCNAGYYSRTDGGNKYTLYKCSLQNGGYQWFLSITPPGMEPGTKNDIDFYFASAKARYVSVARCGRMRGRR